MSGIDDTLNVLMVTPMRREFGRRLDVPHFLHGFASAREIIKQARSSQNAQLREYADTLDAKLFGPRHGKERTAKVPDAPAPVTPAPPPAAPAAGAAPNAAPTEAEMRARMMSKYRTGLR